MQIIRIIYIMVIISIIYIMVIILISLVYGSHRFESLDLPFLPADRSLYDVHEALLDDKVLQYVIL